MRLRETDSLEIYFCFVMPQRTYKTRANALNIFFVSYLIVSDGVQQLGGVSKGFWILARMQNSKALLVLLPDSWKPCWLSIFTLAGWDLPRWSIPQGFVSLRARHVLVLFNKDPSHSINTLGRAYPFAGIPLHFCLPPSTSSAKYPRPLWKSCNPARPFP